MISPKTLRKYKLDSASLEKAFTAKKKSKEIEKLIDLIAARNKDGAEYTLRNHRVWAAVDLAYDAPFYQETPTLLRHILSTCNTGNDLRELENAVTQWHLSADDVFCKVKDKAGKESLAVNTPLLFAVVIPYVRAGFALRFSKIYNDRNGVPLFKFEPQKLTEVNRIRCEIWEDLVQTMATQFGYSEIKRQLIFNALLYSTAIMFPMEPWYEETQEDEDGKDVIEKRGVRHAVPHINRIFYDLQYPVGTLNSNTGCSYAGYYTIMRWGDVDGESRYWNRGDVGYGSDWFNQTNSWSAYLRNISTCVQRFPAASATDATDRETYTGNYTSGDYDKAVFVVNGFHRLVPKDWGLGDYKYPVWFKFTTASDRTVIWAESYSYNPLVCALYDPDQNRVRNASLGLELIPAQDMIGNLVNQWLLTMKQNLSKLVFYNTDKLPNPDIIENLKVRHHWQYQATHYVPFSMMKDRFDPAGRSGELFQQVDFGYSDSNAMVTGIGAVFNLWERMLGMSAQETGSAASHYQGNKEIAFIQSSASNRVTATASGIDQAEYAWKNQMYEAILSHMPADVVSQVSTNIPELEARLKEMGFEMDGKTEGEKKVKVKGKKELLKLEGFASTRNVPDPAHDQAAAQAEYMALASINNNPVLAAIVEPTSLVDMYENAAKKSGADPDFNVKINKDALAVQSVQKALPQIAAALEKDVEEKIIKPMEDRNLGQDKQINQLAQEVLTLVQRLKPIFEMAAAAPPLPPVQPQPPITNEIPITAAPGNPIAPVAEMAQPAGV